MTSEFVEETTDRSSFDANRTLLPSNLSVYDDDDDDAAIDEDELVFYFALYKVTVPTTFGVIILIGLVGNLLVVGVTLSRHKMWTTVNLLLLNLAVTDVIFVVVCVPFMAYHYAADNWLIGEAVCKMSQFFLERLYQRSYQLQTHFFNLSFIESISNNEILKCLLQNQQITGQQHGFLSVRCTHADLWGVSVIGQCLSSSSTLPSMSPSTRWSLSPSSGSSGIFLNI